MWWARRAILASPVWLFLLLAGCGAVSVQNLGDLQKAQLAEVGFDVPANRAEQLFIRAFRKVGGPVAAEPVWQLNFSLAYSESSTLSVRGTSSSLTSSKMTLTYQLISLQTGKLENSGRLSAEASSGAVSSFYAKSTSARHAEERLAELLGTRLAERLTGYFATYPTAKRTEGG